MQTNGKGKSLTFCPDGAMKRWQNERVCAANKYKSWTGERPFGFNWEKLLFLSPAFPFGKRAKAFLASNRTALKKDLVPRLKKEGKKLTKLKRKAIMTCICGTCSLLAHSSSLYISPTWLARLRHINYLNWPRLWRQSNLSVTSFFSLFPPSPSFFPPLALSPEEQRGR